MKTMEDARFVNMSDLNLARYLRDYAVTRNGEIRALTLAASNRILDLRERLKDLEEDKEDDRK